MQPALRLPLRLYGRGVRRLALLLLWFAFNAPASVSAAETNAAFRVMSAVLVEGGRFHPEQVYNRSGCQGKNISPDLRWTAPPNATRSLAVTMFDPDAPSGHGWWHWAIFNLPPQTRSLPAGAGDPGRTQMLGAAVRQARNDFGDTGYSGPCPPPGGGPHRYVITVYALDVPELTPGQKALKAAEVAAELARHSLARASLTASYGG
jgi:Raf kinase inhibitor-like YbhB/YbcL family protein